MSEIAPDDLPANANPCFEEKNAVSPITAEDFLRSINLRLIDLERAVNQVGSQTTWLVTAFHETQIMFAQMGEQFAKAGPGGVLKMLMGGKKNKNSGEDQNNG